MLCGTSASLLEDYCKPPTDLNLTSVTRNPCPGSLMLVDFYSFLIPERTWLLDYIGMANLGIHSLLPLFIRCPQSEGQDEHGQTNHEPKALDRLSDLQAEVPPML